MYPSADSFQQTTHLGARKFMLYLGWEGSDDDKDNLPREKVPTLLNKIVCCQTTFCHFLKSTMVHFDE